MKQMGDVGVALTTLTIATHTFLVLGLRWHPPTRILSIPVPFIVVSLIWTFIVLAIAIPAGLHQTSDAPYYSNTGYCKSSKFHRLVSSFLLNSSLSPRVLDQRDILARTHWAGILLAVGGRFHPSRNLCLPRVSLPRGNCHRERQIWLAVCQDFSTRPP